MNTTSPPSLARPCFGHRTDAFLTSDALQQFNGKLIQFRAKSCARDSLVARSMCTSLGSSHCTLVAFTVTLQTIAVIDSFKLNSFQLNGVFLLTALKHLMMIV